MSFHHITNPHPFRPAADLSKFFVVTSISNPVRYMRRYELYWRFREMCQCAGVNLITVEQAFGERPFMVTEPDNEFHVQVRSFEELWLKECMLNLGIERATQHGATKIAWIDADTYPMQPPRRWFEEIWHALQHYEFVQVFSNYIDVDEDQNPVGGVNPGFMNVYVNHGRPNMVDFEGTGKKYPHAAGAPGLAWAANVDALNKVGRLVDYSILGAGDWYMSNALVGTLKTIIKGNIDSSIGYTKKLLQWETLCDRWIRRDVGYVAGTLWHDWHGNKSRRRYGSRNVILNRAKYDPDVDVKYDSYGLLQLETFEERQIQLRDAIREYFRQRNEDSLSR